MPHPGSLAWPGMPPLAPDCGGTRRLAVSRGEAGRATAGAPLCKPARPRRRIMPPDAGDRRRIGGDQPDADCARRTTRPHPAPWPHHHAEPRPAGSPGHRGAGRAGAGDRQRCRTAAAGRAGDAAGRPRRAARDPGPERQPHAPHPRRAELQPGAALGRRAQPGRCAGACCKRPGRTHPGAAMGARGRRLDRAPVRREAPADAGRDQRRRAGHAGVHPAPLRPRAAQPRRAARRRLRPRTRRTRRAARSSATPPATRPACCSPGRTR